MTDKKAEEIFPAEKESKMISQVITGYFLKGFWFLIMLVRLYNECPKEGV